MTHTPGPWIGKRNGQWFDFGKWSAQHDSRKNTACIAIGAKGQKVVAIAVKLNPDWDDAELEANATLIAAAPETAAERDRLKEQVQVLMRAIEHVSNPDMIISDENRRVLENAIATIRGQNG